MLGMIGVLFVSMMAWGNPYAEYILPETNTSEHFHFQKRPFPYPFEQSYSVPTGHLEIKRLSEKFDGEGLNKREVDFFQFPFEISSMSYAYPFVTHPHWEILPHPYVPNLEGSDPKKWVNEFKSFLPEGTGLRSLRFHKNLDKLTSSRAYAGNKLKLLKKRTTMLEIYSQVQKSKDHIFISSFMFQCDPSMQKLLALLKAKVEEGVEVYVMYDQKFSLTNTSCKKTLQNIGVKVALHHSNNPLSVFHEKMMVFDGKVAMVLGHNMLASQVDSTGTNNLINDMAIRVEGPMVGVIANRFLDHWSGILHKNMNPKLENLYKQLHVQNMSLSSDEALQSGLNEGKGVCRLVFKGASKKHKSISNLYFETIHSTQNYLFFNMIDGAYRKPHGKKMNEKFLRAVIEKANLNPSLRVDMLTNNWKLPTDVETTNGQGLSQNLFSRISVALGRIVTRRPHKEFPKTKRSIESVLTSKNFHWWSYSQYMHAKTLMADNIFSLVGSYNINPTSEGQSFEQVLACVDQDLADSFQSSIVTDALNSIPVPLLTP